MKKRQLDPDYQFLGDCPVCRKKFQGVSASQIDQIESAQTLYYVECSGCGSSVILGIMKNMPGLITTVGMLTDMNRDDIERIGNLPPITPDDVLEVHKYFEKC